MSDPSRLPVRLIICVDGTWDTSEGSYNAIEGVVQGTVDSIKTISNMIKPGTVESSTGKQFTQHAHYLQGVGTDGAGARDVDAPGMHLIMRAASTFQGATGHGYLDILKKAYKICCVELEGAEDEIFMFGFSRGAFIVRALASLLEYVGLIKTEHMLTDTDFDVKFNDLLRRYALYSSTGKLFSRSAPPELLPFCKPSSRVRFIGAFDTVQAVIQLTVTNTLSHGMPVLNFDMDAPYLVDHFRHALALNEGRPLFDPTLWKRDAKSPDSTYLEAWFFGYHHDIGGGNDHQGLALWPLQWILHAATGYGLVIDDALENYNILFSGGGKILDTPHELATKMFDMIHHHENGASDKFKLMLNESSWGFLDTPRNYADYVTSPPYVSHAKSKVFVHPSAYLIFDISSSFRLQVYEWRYFRKFIRDRSGYIPQVVAPWWEEQTLESILREHKAVGHMRMLVYGPPGVDKSTLITKTFGKWTKADSGVQDISTPVKMLENDLMYLHYSDGFGPGGSDTYEGVEKFLAHYRDNTNLNEQLHALWYCLDGTEDKIAESEKQFFKMNFGNIPVIVVLTKENELREKIRTELAKENINDEKVVEERFQAVIDQKREELKDLPVQGFVTVGTVLESIKNLISTTFLNLNDVAIQRTQIKAQKISTRPKVALATEESVRAYTIWYSSKFSGKQVAFSHLSTAGVNTLSRILMEPILDSFHLRFAGDASLIQSLIGSAWSDLDKYPPDLLNKALPGNLILLCMVDTILVLARACYVQQTPNIPGIDFRQSLKSTAVELACRWYAQGLTSKQKAVHATVKLILSELDWSPKDRSMAALQMKVIDIVEIGLETASDILLDIKDSVVGSGKKVVRGVESVGLTTVGAAGAGVATVGAAVGSSVTSKFKTVRGFF